MKIYRISQLDDTTEEEIEDIESMITEEDSWKQSNYQWYFKDYMINSDTPTDQFELSYNGKYIGIEDSFAEAMQLAYDHYKGYMSESEPQTVTPYDIIDRKIGYTDSFKQAGYIMEDGRLVNLNRPYIDHRAVTVDGSTKSMQEFIADGNIRMIFLDGFAWFDIIKKPSNAQFRIISKIVDMANKVELTLQNGLGEYNDRNESYSGDKTLIDDADDSETVIGRIQAYYGKYVRPSRFAKHMGSNYQFEITVQG